ncbi:MAG: diacylglycerol kinase [Rhizobiaceae bacterium]
MKRLWNALLNSLAGLRWGFASEAAIRQEIVLLALSLPVAPFLTHDPWKLAALWGSLMILLTVELLNTGIEKLADRVTRDRDDLVRIAKDCGSAAVLLATILCAMVWLMALWQKLAA